MRGDTLYIDISAGFMKLRDLATPHAVAEKKWRRGKK
jgi:hypothetical protein